MERCVFCQGLLLRGENLCPHCGRAQPSGEGNQPVQPVESTGPVMGQCPNCGAPTSAWEVVCSACGVPLFASLEPPQEATPEQEGGRSGEIANQPTAVGAEVIPGEPEPGTSPLTGAGTEPTLSLAPGLAAPLGDVEQPDMPTARALASELVFPNVPAAQQENTTPDEALPTLAALPPLLQEGALAQSDTAPTGSLALTPSIGMLPPPQRRRWLKPLSLALAVLLVLGGISAAAYIFTRPRPVLQISGPGQSGSVPTGSADMAFHVSGTDFTAHSAITFLLDGKAAPDAPLVKSDDHGNFTTDLPITDNWLIGQHTLTAKDAKGYVTKTGVSVLVQAAPVIAIISSYQQGSQPVGADGTLFQLRGKRFSLKSTVTVLVDGNPLVTLTPVTTDERGAVIVPVSVDAAWQVGSHTITARDGQGYSTKTGADIVIVPQGVAGTPGPHGAPADNATFALSMNVSAKVASGDSFSFNQFLLITGHPDPAGGTACSPDDDGKPHTYTGTLNNTGESYTETVTFSCVGTYKKGHLTYIETVTSDVLVLSGGVKCVLRNAAIYGAYDGTFTDVHMITGVYFSSYYQLPCNDRSYIYYESSQGTWIGSL